MRRLDPSEKRNWTGTQLEAFPAKAARYDIMSDRWPGLRLRVFPSGKKSWIVEYRFESRRRTWTIGPLGQFSHAKAAEAARKAFNESPDPMAAKKQRIEEQKLQQAEKDTLDEYLTGTYWQLKLSHAKSGEETKKRIQASYSQFMNKPMVSITSQQLEDHRNKRLKLGRSAATLNRERVSLHALFEHAVDRGALTENPVHRLKPLKVDQGSVVRFLTDAERARLMKAVELKATPRHVRDVVRLALFTGMRRGELLNLEWRNVDLESRTVTVAGHTAKSETTRHVRLNDSALAVLEARKEDFGRRGHVITEEHSGKPVASIKKAWAGLMARAKIGVEFGGQRFRFHDLRHTFASNLVMQGVPIFTVSKLLGHASTVMTERYAHLAPDHESNAVKLLDKL